MAALYYIAIIVGIMVAFVGIFMLGTYLMCRINEFTENEKYSKFKMIMLVVPVVMIYAYNGLATISSSVI